MRQLPFKTIDDAALFFVKMIEYKNKKLRKKNSITQLSTLNGLSRLRCTTVVERLLLLLLLLL